jgi:hypothetical protein
MACLALALQPTKGSDILLQTREWFPPARALVALSSFRTTRLAFATGKSNTSDDVDQGLGDDPLAASSGQVIVGKESKYRIVYRLVNTLYVLGITSADQDVNVNNIFECTGIVNQAVSVVVAACRGVDVTPDKLHRKYTEIYMALDIVLRGASSTRLAAILTSIHGEGIAKMVLSAIDAENRARGADNWIHLEGQSVEHQANVQVLSQASFELPEETLSAGDEVAATFAPAPQNTVAQASQQQSVEPENKDPFAVSDTVNKPDELAGGFKKNNASSSDVTAALAELEVTKLTANATAESMFIGVEGFEGDYGGIEFGNEEATLSEAFEGLDDAFGGGLDASEFGATLKQAKPNGLGGLEELETGKTTPKASLPGATPPGVTLATGNASENKGPLLYMSEEINAEFKGSVLKKIGLQGTLYLKSTSPKDSGGKDIEFSFRLDGTAGIKSAIMKDAIVSTLGKGLFHVRTPASENPITVLKYRLQPRFTPLPLRVRLVMRQSGTLLSVMIQYVANPFLPAPLKDVAFILKLPEDPTLLKVSPKATLNRHSQELRWHIPEIQLQGRPGRLRVQMPVSSAARDSADQASRKKEPNVKGRIEFSVEGHTLSGITVCPVSEGNSEFNTGENTCKTGHYLCKA